MSEDSICRVRAVRQREQVFFLGTALPLDENVGANGVLPRNTWIMDDCVRTGPVVTWSSGVRMGAGATTD